MLSKLAIVAAIGTDGKFLRFRGRAPPGLDNRTPFGEPKPVEPTTVPPLTYGEDKQAVADEFRKRWEGGQKLQDGYLPVGCINDGMLKFGDKFGNPQNFKHPISISRYDEIVPTNDQEAMTPDVCFKFCRTLEHAKFFGIRNGAECYCAPYFEVIAGADEDCKIACPGDSSKFCGAQQKSSIFSMHASATNRDFLSPEAVLEYETMVTHLQTQADYATNVPLALVKAGQKLSTTQGSKGNMLATAHHEAMETTNKDYVSKVDNLPNAFRKVQAAQEALTAYKTEINGATPVRAEELVETVQETMVPVGENEYPYEQLVNKVLYKTKTAYVGCHGGYLPPGMWGSNRDITKESCKKKCSGKGHKYFGLTLGGVCDCGDGLPPRGEVDEEMCQVPCFGDPSSFCGKGSNTAVYNAAGGDEDAAPSKIDMYANVKEDATTMCSGEVIQPVLEVGSEDDCARRCQDTISPAKCVGFQYYKGLMPDGNVCMMFSDMDHYVHYNGEGCSGGAMGATCFLQKTELQLTRRIAESKDTAAIEACFN